MLSVYLSSKNINHTTLDQNFLFNPIFEDEEILVINKPPGFLSIQDGYNPDLPDIRRCLKARLGKIWIVHRLDKDTSGILIIAKTKEAHKSLNSQFQNRQIIKVYHAVVHGTPPTELTIDKPLRVNGDRKHRTIIDYRSGQQAITVCKLLKNFHDVSLVELIPKSGYTHQIRVHLSDAGFPILSDPLYSSGILINRQFPISRCALHALSITFQHPKNHTTVSLSAPYAEDFAALLKYLEIKRS